MAPSAETRPRYTPPSPACHYNSTSDKSSSNVIACPSAVPQRKTVAFAVNHEHSNASKSTTFDAQSSSLTNEIQHLSIQREHFLADRRDPPVHGTHRITNPDLHRFCSMEDDRKINVLDTIGSSSDLYHSGTRVNVTKVPSTRPSDTIVKAAIPTIISTRPREQKPRSIPMTTTRVRYDMELVPAVVRNSDFWDSIQTWPPQEGVGIPQAQEETEMKESRQNPDSLVGETAPTCCDEYESINSSQSDVLPYRPANISFDTAQRTGDSYTSTMNTLGLRHSSPLPFLHKSVLWIPSGRKDWEDSVSELTAVCTSAAYRRHDSSKGVPFHPPLSRVYIKDRVKIDDPLLGYQIRHSTGGWLQGFLLWTNFTTWTHYFTWDSLHPLSGLASTMYAKDDGIGSLAKELQALPRHGDPNEGGIVFDHVAEISLLGGLGCGELLLRMAVEEIRKSPNQYRYIVLQATEGSRAFYEKFGFARVGAVCRYGTNNVTSKGMQPNSFRFPDLDTPEQGYRHWTHANESQQSLHLHGGPSYMMCLKLPLPCDASVPVGNLMKTMHLYRVSEKPTIQLVGAPPTPASASRKVLTPPTLKDNYQLTTIRTSGRTKRKTTVFEVSGINRNTLNAKDKTTSSLTSCRKRRKISDGDFQFADPSLQTLTDRPDPTSLPCASPAGNNLRITIYPQRPLSPPPLSSGEIRTVTPRDIPHLPSRKNVDTAPETGECLPKRTIAAVCYTSARNPKVERTTLTADMSAVPARGKIRPNKGATGKKIGRPPKAASAKIAAASTSKNAADNVSPTPGPIALYPQIQASEYMQKHGTGRIFPINNAMLCKQKVKSYPRDRVHFFNKVVRPKTTTKSDKSSFFFVLQYDDASPSPSLTLIPMRSRGFMAGKRAGRPRYQCVVLDTNANWTTDSADKYEAVTAFMVMKTPIVGQEAWDVVDD
jgi:hypothetical protein